MSNIKLLNFNQALQGYQFNKEVLTSSGKAKINFAIIKYWGKENKNLMIPTASSLSFSLKDFYGTEVYLEKLEKNAKNHILSINEKEVFQEKKEFQKVSNFISLFQDANKLLFGEKEKSFYNIKTFSNIPIASGLASSASFFAAFSKAFLGLYRFNNKNLQLNLINQSILARFGSVSASRSVYSGEKEEQGHFIKLFKEEDNAYSKPIKHNFKNLYCGILLIDEGEKKIKSSDAMEISVKNSKYNLWLEKTNEDLKNMETAIKNENLSDFLEIILSNSESLSYLLRLDNICYDLPKTAKFKEIIKSYQTAGEKISFTQDAGANLKVISPNRELIMKICKNEKLILSEIL